VRLVINLVVTWLLGVHHNHNTAVHFFAATAQVNLTNLTRRAAHGTTMTGADNSSLETHSIATTTLTTMANTAEVSASTANVTNDAELNATDAVTAVAQVCNTPELLEAILSHLPVLDLIVVIGVCKTFREVVQTSPRLQVQLFMRPTQESKEYWQAVLQEPDTSREVGRFAHLHRAQAPDMADTATVQADTNSPALDTRGLGSHDCLVEVVSVCPLLTMPQRIGASPNDLVVRMWTRKCGPIVFIVPLNINEKFLRAAGPWRDMFITNSHCQEAHGNLIWEGHVDGKVDIVLQANSSAFCKEGLTVPFILDEIARQSVTVGIGTYRHDSRGKRLVWDCVQDTTLHEQIAICTRDNSRRVMHLSMESEICLRSMIAPRDSEYKDMTVHGRVVIPIM
jgi:hypothetical protein